MMTDNIHNMRSLLFGSIITLSFLGVSLIIHNFIMFYALENTSENLYKFRENHSKMPGNNKLLTPLKQFSI